MQKLYCYVDESGQDTQGKLFLVSVVITEKMLKEKIENQLLEIEKTTGKGQTKWHGSSFDKRVDYLNAILQISKLKRSVFYSVYESTKEYVPLTTYTIAKAIRIKSKIPYQAIIIIDGLKEKERERTKIGLRQLGTKYKKIRGARDESSPLIRLADAMAGFLRDYEENKLYTKLIFNKLLTKQFLMRLE